MRLVGQWNTHRSTLNFEYGLSCYDVLFSKENNDPNISAFKFKYFPISIQRSTSKWD